MDNKDLIDVMDPVRAMAVDVLKHLPKGDMQLTKSELKHKAVETGTM